MKNNFTRGVLFIHSCPWVLSMHIEETAGAVLQQEVSLEWTEQPAQPKMYRCEFSWIGPVGTGAKLASALRGWEHLRFEVTEDASLNSAGGRWSCTPDLGIFHAQTDVMGNVVIPEERIRAAMQCSNQEELRERLDLALGTAWDEELESFRYAGLNAPVRWLHHVG